jgi:hypothetical protein
VRYATFCFVFLAFAAQGVLAQGMPPLSGAQAAPATGAPQAPVGHRQPTPSDLPPDVRKQEEPNPPQSPRQPQSQAQPPARSQAQQSTRSRSQSRQQTATGRAAGGPPVLQVGPSCEAAGRGAVVLGRNKEACLADENAALDTLKQNWSKYAATDKTLCLGMEATGGPASYVELLSCLEVNRDARNIQNADPLEGDLNSSASTMTGSASVDPRQRKRRKRAAVEQSYVGA